MVNRSIASKSPFSQIEPRMSSVSPTKKKPRKGQMNKALMLKHAKESSLI